MEEEKVRNKLKQARLKKRIGLVKFAKQAGIEPTKYSKLESGKQGAMTRAIISRVSNALGLTVGEMLDIFFDDFTPAITNNDVCNNCTHNYLKRK